MSIPTYNATFPRLFSCDLHGKFPIYFDADCCAIDPECPACATSEVEGLRDELETVGDTLKETACQLELAEDKILVLERAAKVASVAAVDEETARYIRIGRDRVNVRVGIGAIIEKLDGCKGVNASHVAAQLRKVIE